MQQFKQLTVYNIVEAAKLNFQAIEQALQAAAFHPGSAQCERTSGWAAPREEDHAPLIESIGGHWLTTFVIETRTVPKDAIEKKLALAIQAYEAEDGRLPGRKAQKALRDDVRASLMPDAFPKTDKVWVWIDPTARTVGISATTQIKTDDVVTGLVRAIEDFAIEHRTDQGMIVTAMREWLLQENDEAIPSDITLGKECTLRSDDEAKAVAQFNNQAVSCEEVRQSIKAGKMPLRLELAFGKRLSLVLCANGALKKIRFENAFLFNQQQTMDPDNDLDGSFTIFASEMGKTLAELAIAVSTTSEQVQRAQDASQRALQGVSVMWARPIEAQSTAVA